MSSTIISKWVSSTLGLAKETYRTDVVLDGLPEEPRKKAAEKKLRGPS